MDRLFWHAVVALVVAIVAVLTQHRPADQPLDFARLNELNLRVLAPGMVQDRQDALRQPAVIAWEAGKPNGRLPEAWRDLGATHIGRIELNAGLLEEGDLDRFKSLFPEAVIEIVDP